MRPALPDPTLEDLRALAAMLQRCLPDKLHPGSFTLKSKLPFKVVSLREIVIHRMAALSTSTVQLLDLSQAVPAAILTRAALETVALLFSLSDAVANFLASKDVGRLNQFLTKGLVGSRWKGAEVQATHVLTFVDRLDREMPGFRGAYDELCEYTHPNWSGLLGAFGIRADGDHELKLGPSDRSGAQQFSTRLLYIGLDIFQKHYNAMIPDLKALNAYFEAQVT